MAVDSRFVMTERHEGSGRWAILEDDGTTGWLYLTARGSMQLEADCWVYNCGPAVPYAQVERVHGAPPPAPIEVLPDDYEPQVDVGEQRWAFEWAADGDAVIASRDAEPVGLAAVTLKSGMNVEIEVDGPWGATWDADQAAKYMGWA